MVPFIKLDIPKLYPNLLNLTFPISNIIFQAYNQIKSCIFLNLPLITLKNLTLSRPTNLTLYFEILTCLLLKLKFNLFSPLKNLTHLTLPIFQSS
jgi:hypothetical protein